MVSQEDLLKNDFPVDLNEHPEFYWVHKEPFTKKLCTLVKHDEEIIRFALMFTHTIGAGIRYHNLLFVTNYGSLIISRHLNKPMNPLYTHEFPTVNVVIEGHKKLSQREIDIINTKVDMIKHQSQIMSILLIEEPYNSDVIDKYSGFISKYFGNKLDDDVDFSSKDMKKLFFGKETPGRVISIDKKREMVRKLVEDEKKKFDELKKEKNKSKEILTSYQLVFDMFVE
jgi:hypothetical protein